MTTIAQRVTAGVDTHKDIHVAAVLDELGRLLEVASFPTTRHGYRRLLAWVQSFGDVAGADALLSKNSSAPAGRRGYRMTFNGHQRISWCLPP